MPLLSKLITSVLLFIVMVTSNSCTSLSYYRQSISGHLDIINKRKSVADLLADDNLPGVLRIKLQLAVRIREYASRVLLLPDNDSYTTYVELGRPYVLWNVVATPEFSLKPLDWCYLVVGCLTYRGYFSREAAASFADQLISNSYDVNIAGVTAYSTLGWFSDPLLNSMFRFDNAHLARVIFHELAHQLIYFSDDTDFNEAFADTVADYGVKRWLEDENLIDETIAYELSRVREQDFYALVRKYRGELDRLYNSSYNETDMRLKKTEIFQKMKSDYEEIRSNWDDPDDYQQWFATGLNNAKLALVLTYKDLTPDFHNLLAVSHYDLQLFYKQVAELEDCDKSTRRQMLSAKTGIVQC